MSARDSIKLLVPNLPQAHELMPRLLQMDARRVYTNFGPLVQEFEAALGQALQSQSPAATGQPSTVHCVTVSSGTAALELTLMAMNLPQGSQVLLPSYTFAATALAVLRCGLVPVFSDVDEFTWQLTPAIARDAVSRMDFSLVLPVATFACPFEGQVWDRFSDETGVPVLIDAAAGFGNQTVGLKTPVYFSLHATKPFGVGEGGFMASADGDLVAQVRRLSNVGFEKGQVVRLGINAKLSEYAAAIGLVQLDRWAGLQTQRRVRWQRFSSELTKVPDLALQAGFGLNDIPSNVVVRHVRAEQLRLQCAAAGIQTRSWYCPPLHQQAAFREMPVLAYLEQQKLSQSEHLGQFTIGLPWHDDLTDGDITSISTQLQDVCQSPRTVRS